LTTGPTASPARRPLPLLTALNRPFWTAGAGGVLHIQRCGRCARFVHPPALLCPHDHADELAWVPVSGRGVVESWTENRHAWFPGFPAPYIIALVTLAEDDRVRLLTNLVGVNAADVTVGMRVRVTFEAHAVDGDEIHVPLFEPDDGT
jgi:uncharacterized OB-fold protein